MTQTQRNNAIVARAYLDWKVTNQCNCKSWATTVVLSASKGVMTLPSTTSNGWSWTPNQYVYTPVWSPYNIYNAQPGNIIQMMLYVPSTGYYGPHTAIVYKVYSDSVDLIQANVTSCKVTIDRVPFYQFVSGNVYPYSVNIIK